MDDSPCLRFFLEPAETPHRRYEALRAYFVERRPLKDIARQTGYSYNTLRDLIGDFRTHCREGRIPPFSPRATPGDHVATATTRRPPPRSNRSSRITDGWTSLQDAAYEAGSPGSSCSYRC